MEHGLQQEVMNENSTFHFFSLEEIDQNHSELVKLEERCVEERNNIILLNYLANEYFRLGYFKKSQAAAKLIIQREPARAKTWQLLARCQLILGEKNEARESLYKCLEHPEAGSRTRKWSADKLDALIQEDEGEQPAKEESAVTDLAQTDEATEAVRQKLEANGVLTAITSTNKDQLLSVKSLYEGNPDKQGIADWYAFLLYSNNETAAAIQIYKKMLKQFGISENTLYYLGCAFLRSANIKMALKYWSLLKKQFPRSYFMPKMFEKIRKLRDLQANGFGLNNKKRQKSEAKLISKAKVFDDRSAVEEAETMLRNDPNNPTVLDWAAYIYFSKENYEKAVQLYDKALCLGFEKPGTYYYMGAAHRALGNNEQAKRVWTMLLKKFPLDKFSGKALDEVKLLD